MEGSTEGWRGVLRDGGVLREGGVLRDGGEY